MHRLRLLVRTVLLMSVICAPAIVVALDQRRWAYFERNAIQLDPNILPVPAMISPQGTDASSDQYQRGAQVTLARYLTLRSPIIDELLPAGAGGTLYVPRLDNATGYAFARSAAIVVAIGSTAPSTVESTEVHERAHLLHAYAGAEARAVLATVASPPKGAYAAKNVGEHFAEMARSAWDLLAPTGDACPPTLAIECLQAFERTVPGTAGFVLLFLRHTHLAQHPRASELRVAAAKLVGEDAAKWAALGTAIEKRRRTDGQLEQWPVPTLRDWVEQHRARARAEGGAWGHFQALAYWPSAMLLRVVG